MELNAIEDVAWIDTTVGLMTPKDFLLECHTPDVALRLDRPAFEVSAQIRFLTSILAVAIHHESVEVRPGRGIVKDLINNGLSRDAADFMVEQLKDGSNVFDTEQPFMQRPALPREEKKIGDRYSTTQPDAVKKLSPGMPPDESEEFWNRRVAYPTALDLPEALLRLTTYHHFSPAGNLQVKIFYRMSRTSQPISYTEKARMGTPGFHFPGPGLTATEFYWRYPNGSFLKTLLSSLPARWVNEGGLPAFADRSCEKSRASNGDVCALWSATWTSNTAIGFWNGTDLVQVRVCGVPEEWLPFPLEKTQEGNKLKFDYSPLKAWWDQRNTQDPFYFYLADSKGKFKAQRLDIGRDPTDLSVEWYSLEKSEKLLARSAGNLFPPRFEITDFPEPVFLRHLAKGTSSSAVIRASEVFQPRRDQWGFDLPEDKQDAIVAMAVVVRDLHRYVTAVFPRGESKTQGGKARTQRTRPLLAGRYNDVSSEFWRRISAVYEGFIQSLRAHESYPGDLLTDLRAASLETFDEITEPYLATDAQQIYELRADLQRDINRRLKDAKKDGKVAFSQDGEQ